MVAQVAATDLILTTIGKVAVRPLAGYLAKNGGKKFAQQYGPKAFEAILGTTVGLKAYKETEEYLSEYINHIDKGGEEESFVPKGSMPDTDRMKQMDSMMAVPNVNPNINRSIRGTPAGLVIGGEAKEILPPPEPFSTPIDSQTATILSTPIPEKVDTTLSTPIPKKIDTKESFPDLSEEANKPIIYYNKKVGKKMLTKESTDYRLQHKPRGPDDEYPVRLDDLTQTTTGESAGYPKDFYSEKGKRIYAPGQSFEGDEFGIANNESYSIINSVRGNPDAEVTIYRAVPNEKNITKINSGDFVTLSKRYADLHGAGGYGRDGTDSGKVLELKVKVKDIYWDQNDVNEFGYFPEKNKTEELKSYIKEENKFWEEEIIPRENKKYPKLNIKNLPKIVEADKHFGAAAMGFQGFEESQLIYMSPQKYLDLTKRFRPVGKQGEGSKLNSDNIEQLLKDGKELANIPFLNVTKVGDSYEVTGQEGIHRAIAFKNLGYDKMPVVIQGTGTDKVAGVENKLYTATPKSYLYTEDWAKDYIGFIPKSIQSDGEVLLTNPDDFYNVRTKEKLFVKDDVSKQTDKLVRGIGDNNPPSSIKEETTESKSLTTQNFLNDDLMNDLLKIRGGIEGFKKNMASEFPKMPASTKNFMEQELQKKLFDKYKLDKYPEGESPETVNEFRKKYLEDTYFKNLGAIEYITSVAYDVIDEKPKDSILVVDEDGLPLAAAKISIPGKKNVINVSDIYHKDSLVIVEAGSIFKNAGDQLFNDIIKRAKEEGKRFVVAEDLTSPEALEAMKKRGFRTTTTKDTKKFKGQKIRRPNGKSAVQKNLVLDLSKEIIKEQTDNLLKKK
jgi:hypothetical protein